MATFFTLLSFVASIVSIFMGGVVLLKNPRETLNRIFFLLCISISYWAYIGFQFRISENIETANAVIRLWFIWPWPSVFVLHFALVFTRQKKILESRLIYYLAYGPSILVSSFFLLFHDAHGEPIRQNWGWTFQFYSRPFVQLELLYVGMLAIVAVLLCLRYYQKLADGVNKTQAKFIIIGLAIPTIAGVTSEVLMPLVGIKGPELTTIGFAIGCGGFVSYAIMRYELFVLTPAATAEEIISTMSAGLFLVSPEGAIQIVNRAAVELLGYSEKELFGKPLEIIFSRQWVDENVEPGPGNGQSPSGHHKSETTITTSAGNEISVSVAVTGLRDTRGRYAGSIIIARDITESKQIEEKLQHQQTMLERTEAKAHIGSWEWDVATDTVTWSDELFRFFKRSPADGAPSFAQLVKFFHPEDAAQLQRAVGSAVSGGAPYEMELRAIRSDGKTRVCLAQGHAEMGPDGKAAHLFGSSQDITERKQAEEALRESEYRLQVIMESVRAGIVIIDPDSHTIVDVNMIAASMIGAPKEEIVGSVCHKFICPAEKGKCPITDLHQTVDNAERVLLSATGDKHPIIKSVTTVMIHGKQHLLESCMDITVLKRIEEQLKKSLAEKDELVKRLNELATHDGLTGLFNHRAFYTLLDDELVRAARFNRPVSLLMLDIDHFKRVNDEHGHLTGDAVLNGLSALLGGQVRAVDRVCRYGGEEITVILPEADIDMADGTAERLRAAVEEHPFDVISGPPLRITVSIGVASMPTDASSALQLVEAADTAMFTAKQSGRNRIIHYETAPSQKKT